MKILLTHRYFAPDSSPYGVILRQIGVELAAHGHEVEVFTTQPAARAPMPSREDLGGMVIRRIRVLDETSRSPFLRAVNAAIYCVALFFHTLLSRADVVTAGTFPPVVAAWCASAAARLRGARFIYHVQDIHPEVSNYSGGRLGRGLPARLLRALDNQSLRRAEAIVTLSEDMAYTLRAREIGPLPIHVMNNPPLDTDGEPVPAPEELVKPEGKTRVIFAGNLGRFQNLPLLTEGVAKCFNANPDLELMFLGDGMARDDLMARWGNHPQVRFADFLPFEQAREIIAGADIGLVSLAPNIYRVAYPSKVATYADLGLRVLALVEPESRLARALERDGTGAVPTAPTAAAIAKALDALLTTGAKPYRHPLPTSTPISWPALLDSLTDSDAQGFEPIGG
ncbi:glycosyltransferase family 4 protein [Celeribacter sp.]|uniref:glycosyltransferase family 4 protein n=1 Tax=Celeribacter sp. TaxID=1890673 RepID=UPI003A916682